jgi:hypothetical protein
MKKVSPHGEGARARRSRAMPHHSARRKRVLSFLRNPIVRVVIVEAMRDAIAQAIKHFF